MTTRKSPGDTRSFDILGITEAEEKIYRQLLDRPGASRQDIVHALGVSGRTVQRLLDTIEAKGLATHSPEHPRRYIPAAPDMAIEALILKRQDDLQRARNAAHDLQEHAAAVRHHGAPEDIVEVIASSEAERLVYEQMHLGAQNEIITLMRPPMRLSSLEPPYDLALQQAAHSRGVRFRTIIDTEFMTMPGAVGLLRSEIGVGTQARGVSHLPFKMVLADRRIAIIPLNLEQPSSNVLLLRSSALLDALYALFEMLWVQGAPIGFSRSGELETGRNGQRLSGGTDDLIPLMAAGMNDKAIAHELSMSARTFERRIVLLMKTLGARSRFQAGWLAALQAQQQAAAPDDAKNPNPKKIDTRRKRS